MAQATVKRLFSVAWTVVVVGGVIAGAVFVVVGSALDRTELWVNAKLG